MFLLRIISIILDNVLVENHINNIGLHPLGDQNNILKPLLEDPRFVSLYKALKK
jgi:hypothetical protein